MVWTMRTESARAFSVVRRMPNDRVVPARVQSGDCPSSLRKSAAVSFSPRKVNHWFLAMGAKQLVNDGDRAARGVLVRHPPVEAAVAQLAAPLYGNVAGAPGTVDAEHPPRSRVEELVVDDRERDFAGVTDPIAVEIGLTRVGQLRTVVGVIGNASTVGIGSRG